MLIFLLVVIAAIIIYQIAASIRDAKERAYSMEQYRKACERSKQESDEKWTWIYKNCTDDEIDSGNRYGFGAIFERYRNEVTTPRYMEESAKRKEKWIKEQEEYQAEEKKRLLGEAS